MTKTRLHRKDPAFPINACVQYTGANETLRSASPDGYSIIDVIPHGSLIGNGEKNTSGKRLLRCRSLYSGTIFNFLETEVALKGSIN